MYVSLRHSAEADGTRLTGGTGRRTTAKVHGRPARTCNAKAFSELKESL